MRTLLCASYAFGWAIGYFHMMYAYGGLGWLIGGVTALFWPFYFLFQLLV